MPIKGTEGMMVSYGKCCRPIPGDSILAYLSPGKGLMVHQQGCRNNNGHEQGSLFPVTNVIARCGSNVHSLNSGEKDSGLYLIDMEITCRNRVHLADIIRKIKVMSDVQRVVRNK